MVKVVSKILTMSNFDKLREFRSKAYSLLGNGRDALFDIMDATLTSRSVSSFAELSLSPVFRRQWPSLYEALQDSNPPRTELLQLYVEQLPQEDPVVLAGDHTAWSRLQAATLQERTYEHQATSMSGALACDDWTRIQHPCLDSIRPRELGIAITARAHHQCRKSDREGGQSTGPSLSKTDNSSVIFVGCRVWLCPVFQPNGRHCL